MTRTERTIFNRKQGIAINREKIAELLKEVKQRRGYIKQHQQKIKELKATT